MNIKKSPQKKYAAGSWLGNTGMAAGAAGSQMQGSPSQNLVSQAGPWGAIIGTASKIGTGISDAIGGDAGGAVKGMFDPAAITFNKDLSTGKRIIGSALPMLGGIWANKAAEKKKAEQEKAAELEQSKQIAMSDYANSQPQQQYSSTFANGGMIKSYEGGGQINQSTGLPNITEYKVGGTHQQNSMGGIPLGKTGNSVEENEVRFGDYIFSDRIPYKKFRKK